MALIRIVLNTLSIEAFYQRFTVANKHSANGRMNRFQVQNRSSAPIHLLSFSSRLLD